MPLRTYLGPRVCCLAKARPRSPIWFTYSFDSWRSYMVHLGSRNFHQLIDDLWHIWCMVYLGPKSCVNHRVHMPVLLVTCFQHFNNTLGNQTLKPNVLLCQSLKLPKYLIPPGHRLHFSFTFVSDLPLSAVEQWKRQLWISFLSNGWLKIKFPFHGFYLHLY